MPAHLPPEVLEAWLAAAAEALQLDPAEVSIATVLDLARDVAHGVARPAAPLTTFLLGLAYGRALVDAGPAAAPGPAASEVVGSGADGAGGAGSASGAEQTRSDRPALAELADTLTRLAGTWNAPSGAAPTP